jgi:RNA polymerase sigma factor (sigma-70 family)
MYNYCTIKIRDKEPMNPTNVSLPANSTRPTDASPSERVERLYPVLFKIAMRFWRSDPSPEDVVQHMAQQLLELCQADPRFMDQTDAYWRQRAKWEAFHFINASVTYRRYVHCEALLKDDARDPAQDPYNLYNQAVEPDPCQNPERAAEISELRRVIKTLPPSNRRLAAMLMIGYNKAEVAQLFGISRPAVSQRLSTIGKHLIPAL